MSRVHCFSGNVTLDRSRRVPTADGRGWTSVIDRRETGTVNVEIDVGEIIRQLGQKAMLNKSRSARGLSGLIKVKVMSIKTEVTS
jgi:hypothetical protein